MYARSYRLLPVAPTNNIFCEHKLYIILYFSVDNQLYIIFFVWKIQSFLMSIEA